MTTTTQFLKDIERHEMHILRDDGVYRHVRFKRQGSMCMHFDLVTWPGYLCYTGDMGTYVFTRLNDMFEFFRRDTGERQYRIDFRYWAEKCEGADKGDGVQEFDVEAFRAAVKRQGARIIRSHRARAKLSKDERRELWEQLQTDVLDLLDPRQEQVAFNRAYEFSYAKGSFLDPGHENFHLELEDFPSCKRYSHRFLWCCHALAWGINVYDTAREAQKDVA